MLQIVNPTCGAPVIILAEDSPEDVSHVFSGIRMFHLIQNIKLT